MDNKVLETLKRTNGHLYTEFLSAIKTITRVVTEFGVPTVTDPVELKALMDLCEGNKPPAVVLVQNGEFTREATAYIERFKDSLQFQYDTQSKSQEAEPIHTTGYIEVVKPTSDDDK